MSVPRDIAWSRQLGGNRAGQVALWAAAMTLAVGAHGAAAWWIMRQPPIQAADGGEPTAIMIDLAPVPMAPVAIDDQVAPDEVDSVAAEAPVTPEEAEAADAVETGLADPVTPETQVEETTETAEAVEATPVEPLEAETQVEQPAETAEAVEATPAEPLETDDMTEVESESVEVAPAEDVAEVEHETIEPIEIDPIEEMVTAELDRVTVPVPTARPEPPPRPQPQQAQPQQPRPQPQQAQPAPRAAPSRQQTQAQAQTQQPAPRAAAPQTSSSAASSVSPATWQSQLMAHLERRKRYPAAARRQRQEGTAQVRFTIDAGGNVQSVSLVSSSGVPALDEEVVSMVRRASPVPAPPPGVGSTIVVPVRFSLR